MKRAKKLYLLLAVLVVVCAAAFLAGRVEKEKERIKNSDEIILEVDGSTVTSLSWKYDTEELAFHKDEGWIWDEDENFPVSEEKINELLDLFREFGVSFVIEDVEDFEQYGLTDPECTIRFETEDTAYEILVGNYSAMDEERYVSVGDGNVYLVKNDPMDLYGITIRDMIQNDETPELETVSDIRFSGNSSLEIVYEEDSKNTWCRDDVYFAKDGEERKPLDTSRVESYLSTVRNLDLTDYAVYNVSEEELADYGLETPALTLTADDFTLHVGQDQDEAAYARVGDSKIIYNISEETYNTLIAADYDDFRHKAIVTADLADVTKADITLEGKTYTIEFKEKDDEILCTYEGEEVEATRLPEEIEGLWADSFTEETPSQKEEISFILYLDNETYPELKVQLYRYDGSDCLALVNGEPVALVERGSVVDLIEAVNEIVLN